MIVMALNNQPFSMAEDDGFIGLMAHLQPQYMIPSQRYFAESALPELYNEIKAVVTAEIISADSVSFTSDIWTCPTSHETYISLSGHWIACDFQHRDAVLHASHFPVSHTGVNISEKFRAMWEAWGLDASNMALGSTLAEIESVHCSIHLLQLVINDAMLSQRMVKDILAKSQRLCTHFNHSAQACTECKAIQNEQGLDPLLLVHDVPKRWNSVYLMLS